MSKLSLPIFRRRARDTSREAYEEKRDRRGYTDDGQIVDNTPVAPPVGYKKQPSMVDIIREQIRNHKLALDLDAAGVETFDEADDFDVGDPDDLPRSIYEMEENFDPPIRDDRKEPDKKVEAGSDNGVSSPTPPTPAADPPAT